VDGLGTTFLGTINRSHTTSSKLVDGLGTTCCTNDVPIQKNARTEPKSAWLVVNLIFFTLIRAHTNFHNRRTTPSGRKVIRWREKEEERKKEKKQ
jgi:hypothetical protein